MLKHTWCVFNKMTLFWEADTNTLILMILFIRIRSDIGTDLPPVCHTVNTTLILTPIGVVIPAWRYGELRRAPPPLPSLGRSSCIYQMRNAEDVAASDFWLQSGSQAPFYCWTHFQKAESGPGGSTGGVRARVVHLAPAALKAVRAAGPKAGGDGSQCLDLTCVCSPNGCW